MVNVYILAGIAIASFVIGLAIGYLPEHNKLVAYQSAIAQAGRDQAAQTKAKDAEFQELKGEADAQRNSLLTANTDLADKLYNARAHSSVLPKTTSGSASPARACLDSAQLDAAIQRLDAGVQALITTGDSAVIGLNTAKNWTKAIQ